SGRSPRSGIARRCCPRRAGQTAQCGSSLPPKTVAGWRGGSPLRLALPVPSPARISFPSALLQWLRWARNPPYLNPPLLSHRRCCRPVEGPGAVHELRPARCELDPPTHAALGRTTKPLRCSSAAASELSIGISSVDQTSTRETPARPAAPVPARRSS